jgi:hypothetical protein
VQEWREGLAEVDLLELLLGEEVEFGEAAF